MSAGIGEYFLTVHLTSRLRSVTAQCLPMVKHLKRGRDQYDPRQTTGQWQQRNM